MARRWTRRRSRDPLPSDSAADVADAADVEAVVVVVAVPAAAVFDPSMGSADPLTANPAGGATEWAPGNQIEN